MPERRSERSEEKILAFLIIIAVLISITATFFSLRMLNELEMYKEYFTGHGTTGEIRLLITQNITLEVTQTLINFSSGYVTTGQSGAWLNSSATGYWASNPTPNWINLSLYDPRPLEVRNDGNTNLNVNLTSGQAAAGFIGGTSPVYQFNASHLVAEPGACGGTLAAWTDLNPVSPQSVCTNLTSAESVDELYVHCNLFIPSNAVGTKSDTWTFSAILVS